MKETHDSSEIRDPLSRRRSQLDRAFTLYQEICQREMPTAGDDIREIILQRGPVPFDVWMAGVLYGRGGYYSSGEAQINTGRTDAFHTKIKDPQHVAAIYRYAADHLRTKGDHTVVSLASGTGHFDEYFRQTHRYLHGPQAPPHQPRLSKRMSLYGVDISESLLRNQRDMRADRSLYKQMSDGKLLLFGDTVRDAQYEGMTGQAHAGDKWAIPLRVLQEVSGLIECVSPHLSTYEYRQYYHHHIEPILRAKLREQLGDTEQFQETMRYLGEKPHFVFQALMKDFGQSALGVPVQADGLALPFADASVDLVFHNELHDAGASMVYEVPGGHSDSPLYEMRVGYDRGTKRFSLTRKEASGIRAQIAKLKLDFMAETQKAFYDGGTDRKFMVVNMSSAALVRETARILKPNGLALQADYTARDEADIFYESLRFQRGRQWGIPFTRIHEYIAPWTDVTTDMNPEWVRWVGEAYGLQQETLMRQEDLKASYTGLPFSQLKNRSDYHFLAQKKGQKK